MTKSCGKNAFLKFKNQKSCGKNAFLKFKLLSAKSLGRNYIGCDINPKAVEITKERLENLK